MKEHEFKCKKCGNTWYATDKDIRESRKQQSNIQRPLTWLVDFMTLKSKAKH